MRDNLQQTSCLLCNNSSAAPLISIPAQMMKDPGSSFQFVRCPECGLVYLNPRVEAKFLNQYYPDYYLPYRGANAWGNYAGLVKKGQLTIDKKRAKLAKHWLSINDGNNVLDIGCGNPTFLKLLVKDKKYVGTGIDFNSEGWQATNERWRSLNLVETDPIDFHSDIPYDLITMWHYLEHDYHPLKTLKHLKELSHDHTTLIVEVPDYEGYTRKKFGQYWEGYHVPRHTAVYTENTLIKLLSNAGWETISTRKYGTLDTYSLWWMSEMEKKEIDWSKSMESQFWGYVWGKILTMPLFALKRWIRLGVQLAVARPKKT